eukprot:m.71591 g.71591  ORF g.71591 m.71591 type:complete len:350 (-) comp24367_c0_seq1:29-1078(-)
MSLPTDTSSDVHFPSSSSALASTSTSSATNIVPNPNDYQYMNSLNYGASTASTSPLTPTSSRSGKRPAVDSAAESRDSSKRFRDSTTYEKQRDNGSFDEAKVTDSPFTPMTDKQSKGLRHFSMKVCQKVKEKGITTYNEVADELVQERQAADNGDDQYEDAPNEPHGPKNIRRRVYDALNVLMAMKIISKEKKEIRWIGLPNNSVQEFSHMEDLRAKKLDRIKRKTAHLQELILQQLAFKNLIKRNAAKSKKDLETGNCVHLPFIIVNTSKETAVNCQVAEDKTEYFFDFDKPFEIHDDIEVLKRMGLAFNIDTGKCTAAELEEARKLIPSALYPYLEAMVNITDPTPT